MMDVPTFVGIDVAKDRPDVVFRLSGEYRRVGNDERDIRSLVSRLRGEDLALVALEATGRLEQPVCAALAAESITVAVVNPRQGLRQGHGSARQDRPHRRVRTGPLRRGG